MRRLGALTDDEERGAIAVLLAIVMVVVLGFAAIAVDVGMLYSERAQLQNGADAGAVFVAQKCASKLPSDAIDCNTAPSTGLRSVVGGNAVDGLTKVEQPIALSTQSRTVTVSVKAQEPGKTSDGVSTFFARVLGISTVDATATASARWGTPTKGIVPFPLAIAVCKFNLAEGTPKATEQMVEMGSGCGTIPGGFGWINDSDTKCSVNVTAGQSSNSGIWFTSDTGASAPTVCSGADAAKMNDQTVLFPLYDVATGTGSNGQYYVKGFAAFHVTGYHFSDISWSLSGGSLPNKTIRGYFVQFVSLSQSLELGDAPSYGTSLARLTIGAP